jgi:hypothetical protein
VYGLSGRLTSENSYTETPAPEFVCKSEGGACQLFDVLFKVAVPNPLGKVGEDQNPRLQATD